MRLPSLALLVLPGVCLAQTTSDRLTAAPADSAQHAPLAPGERVSTADLWARLDRLEREYTRLERSVVAADSAEFASGIDELRGASLNHSELIVRFDNLRDNKDMSDGLVQIVSINNVGGDNALGFDFTGTMTDLVDATISASLDEPRGDSSLVVTRSARGRWSGIVERLVTSPLVSDLIRSNPFTSLASSVISSAMAFTSNHVNTQVELDNDVEALPKKYSQFKDNWVDYIKIDPTGVYSEDASRLAISQDAIEDFVASITPYAALYDSMSTRNVVFETQLGDWQAGFDELGVAYREYTDRLAAHLDVPQAKVGAELDDRRMALVRMDPDDPLRFSRALRENAELFALTSEFSDLRDSAEALQEEFYALHRGYFRDYVQILKSARGMAESGLVAFDVEQIDEAIADLRRLAG